MSDSPFAFLYHFYQNLIITFVQKTIGQKFVVSKRTWHYVFFNLYLVFIHIISIFFVSLFHNRMAENCFWNNPEGYYNSYANIKIILNKCKYVIKIITFVLFFGTHRWHLLNIVYKLKNYIPLAYTMLVINSLSVSTLSANSI